MASLDQAIEEFLVGLESINNIKMVALDMEARFGAQERTGGSTEEEVDRAWLIFCKGLLQHQQNNGFVMMTPDSAKAGLQDNYFDVALNVALQKKELADQPVLAWAAFNKSSYSGYSDEIAVVRLLIAAGFNPNLQDGSLNTALHYMCWWKPWPCSSPRGVRLLLKAGADPNIQNHNGDNPLAVMAGSHPWPPILTESAMLLLANGANPHLPTNDGLSALKILKQIEADSPDENRAALIEVMEGV